MKLEGSLDAFSLPDVFALLSMTKKTGALRLHRAGVRGVVHLTTGSITGASSDTSRLALARRLVGAGMVEEAALREAVSTARSDPARGLARALQASGAIDEGALHEVVTEHVRDAVFELMRWPDGEFAFAMDEADPDDVGVSLPVDDVVAEARRRLDAWSGMVAAVPAMDAVLSVCPEPPDPALGREEWALLALVDGRRSVADVVDLAGRGEYAVISLLAGMVSRGLLQVGPAGESALAARQSLLAELEGVPLPATEPAPAPTAPPAEPVAEQPVAPAEQPAVPAERPAVPAEQQPTVPAGEAVSATEPAAAEPVLTEPAVAEPVTAEPPVAEPVVPAQPGGEPARPTPVSSVVPSRPEPFLPPRRPEHPDQMPHTLVGHVEGSAAVAPQPSYIERDPSVNKSLLLRLIAGVRGL